MSKTTVKDPWCQLAGHTKCFLESPRNSLTSREIIRKVIPTAGSKICRFGGQIEVMYTLAQHMCGVARWVRESGGTVQQELQALLHDGAECILGGDIPKPVREKVFGYDSLEDSFLDRIMEIYELPKQVDDLVWDGDVALLVVEAEAFLEGGPIEKWTDRYIPAVTDRKMVIKKAFGLNFDTIPVWTISDAQREYISQLDRLTQLHLTDQLKKLQRDYCERHLIQ